MRRVKCSVRRQINVKAESVFLIGSAHRDFSQRDAQTAMRAVVRRPEQPALGARHEQLDESALGVEIDTRRLSTDEVMTHLPVRRPAQLVTRLAEHEDDVAGRTRVTRYGALGPCQ